MPPGRLWRQEEPVAALAGAAQARCSRSRRALFRPMLSLRLAQREPRSGGPAPPRSPGAPDAAPPAAHLWGDAPGPVQASAAAGEVPAGLGTALSPSLALTLRRSSCVSSSSPFRPEFAGLRSRASSAGSTSSAAALGRPGLSAPAPAAACDCGDARAAISAGALSQAVSPYPRPACSKLDRAPSGSCSGGPSALASSSHPVSAAELLSASPCRACTAPERRLAVQDPTRRLQGWRAPEAHPPRGVGDPTRGGAPRPRRALGVLGGLAPPPQEPGEASHSAVASALLR
mmetsp:Transcript_57376/g.180262  ORF Transcript_57376/g.180262 Transcript_57376/m.180262 type:complete len:288 (-) Transcript_57376:321-1184(-)